MLLLSILTSQLINLLLTLPVALTALFIISLIRINWEYWTWTYEHITLMITTSIATKQIYQETLITLHYSGVPTTGLTLPSLNLPRTAEHSLGLAEKS